MSTNMTVLNTDTPPADAPSPDSPPPDDTAANDSSRINIKVLRQDGSYLFFLIKMNTPLDILMKKYCINSNLPMNGVRLVFNGRQVCRHDTPASLEMEDGDALDAFHDF